MAIIERIAEIIGRFIRDHNHLIILAAVLLLLLAITSAQRVSMETGIGTQVFTDTQLYKDIDYYNHHFNTTSGQYSFLILVTTDNVYDPQVLDAMGRLENAIRGVKKVTKVWGIQDYISPVTLDNAAQIAPQVAQLSPALVQSMIADRNYSSMDMMTQTRTSGDVSAGASSNLATVEQQVAQLSPDLVQSMIIDRHHSLMYVTSQSNIKESEKPPIMEDIRKAVQFTPLPAGTSTLITGTTARMIDVQKEMVTNMSTMLVTSVLLMVAALWITFSRARWRLLPLPIVVIGVIYTAGIMGQIDVPLTMVSMAVFPILIGLGVEYAIQFHNRMMEELESGKTVNVAVVDTVKGIGPPVLYSVTCTCLGFYSVLSTPVPMVYDFGLMCLIGVIVCFLVALLLLPSILVVLARRSHFAVKKGEQKANALERAIEAVAETTTKHPETVIIATIFMLVGFVLDSSVGIEVDMSTFVPQDLPAIVNYRSFSYAEGYKTGDLTVIIKGDDVTRPDVVRWMQDFADLEKRDNPDVLGVNSLATQIAARNNGTLPATPAGMQEAIASMPPGVLNMYVDDYRSSAVILFNINTADTPHLINMLHRVEKDLQFLDTPAGVTATLSGEQMATQFVMESLGDRLKMTLEAGFFVFVALMIFFKGDWVRSFVPTYAVIIVTGLSALVMILLHMKYTPLSTTLGSLTIGIGVDFSILHMERYYEEKAKGYSPREAMRIATGKIGSAIFCSACTVCAGFGSLAMSNFSILSNFGIVTIIDFLMALCSAFMIMPPLLVTLDTWWMKVTHKEAIPSHA